MIKGPDIKFTPYPQFYLSSYDTDVGVIQFTFFSQCFKSFIYFFRAVIYYRGDTVFKVRYGQYKAHFYTWDTPEDSQVLVGFFGISAAQSMILVDIFQKKHVFFYLLKT